MQLNIVIGTIGLLAVLTIFARCIIDENRKTLDKK